MQNAAVVGSLTKAARASLYTGGDECHPVKIYPFQQFEISSRGESRRYPRPGTTRARQRVAAIAAVGLVTLNCRVRAEIKMRRIVRRINMSILVTFLSNRLSLPRLE